MTNSWDWVEKHNRRERQRKLFRFFGIIMMLFFLLFVIGIPPIFKFNDDRQQAKTDQADNSAEPVAGGTESSDTQPVAESHRDPLDDEFAVKSSSEIASTNEADMTDEPLADTTSTSAVRLSPIPEAATPDPKLLRAAERIKSQLERRIERLDAGDGRLTKFGGAKWESTRKLADSALNADDPVVATEAAEQALGQLDALVPDLDYAEFIEQTRGKEPRAILTALVKFRSSHPDHPRLNELEQSLTRLSREKWLAMASKELKEASPDDAGFSEGWLPLASAWQLVGNDAEAREAIRQAIEALPRMTLPERVIESTIEICQHESFGRSAAQQLIENAATMCEQVSEKWTRGIYFANLSGLASKLELESLAKTLLERSLSPDNMTVEFGVTQKLILTQQARAASWTESPETVLALCAKLEKLNYPKAVINANAYGHAAIAAARHNDRTQFFKAMLLTENALAPVRVYDYPNYLYAVRLAEANILQRRWRAAVIIANNIPDPYIRSSLLFRIMKDAPQEIRARNLPDLIEKFADQRWAALACAGHAEHRIRAGENLLSVAEWTQSLPLASQRAAAFAGIARSVGTTTVPEGTRDDEQFVVPVDINDSDSVMAKAERITHMIQEPLDAAFVWMQIARTWKLMGKTGRYQQALDHLDDRLFDAWTGVWEQRPSVKRSYNGGYIDSDKRHRDDEQRTIGLIVACHRHLAEMQADLGDSRGAMESLLNWANAAGFAGATATYNDQNFLRMKALLNRLQGVTKVGPDSLPFLNHRSYRYTRALVAAWADDIPGLEAALPELVENSHRKLGSAAEKAQPARAYGELAILYAERGNIEAYRDARRSAQSLITQGRAGSEMKLPLATADAVAGEFALAESNLVRGTLAWYGDANLPRKQLAISLAENGQWEKALEHAHKVSSTQPLYRAEAFAAVAKARLEDDSTSRKELLDWASSLESQVDRAAVFCGLGLTAAGR